MKIGTYYYPEQWPREQWTRDFDSMASMGLQIVHIGEFAWGTIEPREGAFQLDWIDECMRLASERRMDVILCTPSAVLPIWMVDRDPSVLFTGLRFGGRRHANHLHPLVRERSRLVAEAMAKRFGHHPSLIGWQIDNEFGGPFDQSEVTRRAFHDWLSAKYGSIDALNQAWGCAFWNTYYTSFEQVKFPARRDPEYRSPHECLDASRFWSDSFAGYAKLQSDAIRPHSPGRWVTTNFMPFFPDIDPNAKDCREAFDLWSWDTYPVHGTGKAYADERFRIADPSHVGYVHEQMRSHNGRWALMEVQPGQVNWSGYPVQMSPGAVRLLLWQAFCHRADFVTVYRFRRPRMGIELFHDGLVDWDGVTPMRGGREFAQTVRELSTVRESLGGGSTLESLQDDRPVAILHDHDQLLYYLSLPQSKRFDYPAACKVWHAASLRAGASASVVTRIGDAKSARVLIVPAYQMIEPATVEALRAFADEGGHVVITGRTALMDRTGQAWEAPYAGPIHDLIGARVIGYDALPEETFGTVEMSGKHHKWGAWGDQVQPDAGTEVWACYVDQFYAGTPAVTHAWRGKGSVTFVGPVDAESLAEAVMEKVLPMAGISLQRVPASNVRIHKLGAITVMLNFSPTAAEAPAPAAAKFLVGERRVPPAGVAVWK
jgi:beta-galactosidase